MRENLVSVIVPVFNCENYIKRALESLVRQTYKEIEIIIVDDGSTDNSQKICNEYKENNSNISLYSQENKGVSAARNFGISISKGNYIYFMDADDYIEDNTIFEYVKCYKENPELQLVISGFYSEVDNSRKSKMCMKTKYYNNINEIKKDFVTLWDCQLLYNIWNKLYLKSIIVENNIEFPDYNWGEDIQFNRDYLLKVDQIINLEKCFYHYVRERKGAITNQYIENFFDIRLQEYYQFNEYFENYGIQEEEYIEFSSRRYIERTLGCIENLFVKSCKLTFKDKYNETKRIIKNNITKKSLKIAKPKSIKMKIMLLTYKYNLILLAMLLGKILYYVKNRFPSLFNKLKNER